MVQASVAHQHRNKPTQIKMKFVIVAALALVAVASAAPAAPAEETVIVRSENEQQPDGPFVNSYETSDGTKVSVTGELKEVLDEEQKPKKVIVVRGSYEFIDPEGNSQLITYVADENGYHAEGEGVPKEVKARR